MEQPLITLNDGVKIPQTGFGTFQINGNGKTAKTCLAAIDLGYRHIDTAHVYRNERGVGKAIEKTSVPRSELFITSKLWVSDYGEKSEKAIDKMLGRLKTDYLDLLLLHRPRGDYFTAWRALEKAKKAGKVRSIGLSNFENEDLDALFSEMEILPSVMQVECHPYFQQKTLMPRLAPHDIKIESWFPLGHANKELFREPIFLRAAERCGKTVPQTILRWHIQKGFIVFPKSTNVEHIKQNLDIFDFDLTDEEMNEIAALDRNASLANFK
ncbi:MAG: aldo/keto reductase [Clostridia bacterium]|nr:aldo/keto reductase [Clostridia bacterium]